MPSNADGAPGDPEAVNSTPTPAADAASRSSDPNDEIPVPEAMSAAEIDERGQVVESLRGKRPLRGDTKMKA